MEARFAREFLEVLKAARMDERMVIDGKDVGDWLALAEARIESRLGRS